MLKQKGKLYIAYGSNLNLTQMKHRCPTAEIVGKSKLKDYHIVFRGEEGGVANVEPHEGSSVPVLIWRIYPQDERSLDLYEGVPHFYHKETMTVEFNGEKKEALIYIMNDGFREVPPNPHYYFTILEGYQSAGFNPTNLQAAKDKNAKYIMTDRILKQIMAIRDSGETNMFDTNMVKFIANREGYYELVYYIENHCKEYAHFILTGKES